MQEKTKNILKIILFCSIFLALLMVFSLMMKPQKWFDEKLIQNRDARYVQMTEQPENTIDVLNIGDSLATCTFSPVDLWRQQGYTGFNIGADGLRMAESYYYILNACKNQKPKVLLIESLYLFRYSLGEDTQMLLSQPIYYRVPFLKYHNIWKSLVEMPGVMIYHRGYIVNEDIGPYEGPDNYMDLELEDKNQRMTFSWLNRMWFRRIKKYCDERDIRIIIYSAVSSSNYNWTRIQAVEEFAKDFEGRVKIGKINVDEESELAMRFGVQSIPSFVFIKDGKVVDRVTGAMPKPILKNYLEDLAAG